MLDGDPSCLNVPFVEKCYPKFFVCRILAPRMKISSDRKKQKILSLVSSSFLLLVLTSMDFLSFGTKFLNPKTHGISTENISIILFLYPSIVAQLVFGMFTGMSGGVCSGAIMEAQKDTRRMHEVCTELSGSFGEALFSTYICIFLSTILYATISYLFQRFKVGGILKCIPISALYGVMGSIGILSLKCGYDEIYTETAWTYMHYCFGVSVALALLAMWLDMRFPTYFLMVPTFAFVILVTFHIVFILAGKDGDWLRSMSLIPQTKDMNLMFTELLKHFKFSNINTDAIKANWKSIIGLALFNLIHITVNVPSFAESVGVKASLDDELKAQSVGNFVSAFFGYPTYFICSTSIYFNKSGGKSRMHSIIGAAVMCSLVFVGATVRGILPVILIATIPMFIGFSFLYSYVYLPMLKLSYADFSILLVSAAVSWFLMPVYGLVFGIVANSLYTLLSYSKSLSKITSHSRTEGKNGREARKLDNMQEVVFSGGEAYRVVNIGFLVFFGTVEKLRIEAGNLNSNIIFDIRKCGHFDANANIVFEEIVNEITSYGHKVLILGNPSNLYLHLFSRYIVDSTDIEIPVGADG